MPTDHERLVENGRDITYLRELMEAEIRRIDQVLAEREKQVKLAFDANDRATTKYEADALRAREAQNEWRASMNDLRSSFATIETVEDIRKTLDIFSAFMLRAQGGIYVIVFGVPLVSSIVAALIAYLVSR